MTTTKTHSGSSPLRESSEKSGFFANMFDRTQAGGPRIWTSSLSWKLIVAAFLTIMTVQAGLLAFTINNYEATQLEELALSTKNSIAPMLEPTSQDNNDNAQTPPFTKAQSDRLLTLTSLRGYAVYSTDRFHLVTFQGEPVVLSIFSENDLSKTYRSNDGKNYEVIFRPKDLNARPYYIVARLDASGVTRKMSSYIQQNIIVMLSMSVLMTAVLMIGVGKWLLEPIFFLKDNLALALANPESPNIQKSYFDQNDEIGSAIEAAQELIKQNTKNLRQIKNAAQSQIHKLAYYDTLTSLPNRTLFIQKLGENVRIANGDQTKITRIAVIAIDLDHFKDVNDSMGHNVGDAILGAVGKRLRAALPESAVVARTGEDEFAITVPLVGNTVTAKEVGEKIRSIITHEPFKVFNESFQIRASIGVATFPDDAIDPDQVLKNADIALNRAKEDGRDCIREYLEDFDKAVQARFLMLRDLRNALEHSQLMLYYQPQLDLRSGKVIGAEALIRWFKSDNSKEGGKFISPGEFIPIAEQSGLIVPIGEWVMMTACTEAKKWHDAGHNIRIAINVSGEQFQKSNLVAFTKYVLETTKISPHMVELEVTESAFMEDIQQTILTLKELHALGVELAIDDFGTGYSSLSYLRQFPIDRLKIDQSFIRNALNNNDDAAIARTIIGLGRSLNLKVIAEGVETLEHEKFLLQEGCDEVQGFRYSRPVNFQTFNEFVANYTGNLDYFSEKPV